MAALPLAGVALPLNELARFSDSFDTGENMPVLFLGHGSPMNAIDENEFVRGFRAVSKEIPRPNAILCVSAHWETQGTFVTAMPQPKTIHDFGGFPKQLFDVQYPAPGNPSLAEETRQLVKTAEVGLDEKWGLDHGAWSVIKHLYPKADVPVIQMSLDYNKNPQYHYELARELRSLRKKGVLIIGSGNIVHNLGMVEWKRLNESFGYDWAVEANEKIKGFIDADNHRPLIDYSAQGRSFELSIPSPDHYLPLLYALALKEKYESVSFFNDKPVAGSISMTSLKIEKA